MISKLYYVVAKRKSLFCAGSRDLVVHMTAPFYVCNFEMLLLTEQLATKENVATA
jgi:hypothetical protein